jgi:hypothetical protein
MSFFLFFASSPLRLHGESRVLHLPLFMFADVSGTTAAATPTTTLGGGTLVLVSTNKVMSSDVLERHFLRAKHVDSLRCLSSA